MGVAKYDAFIAQENAEDFNRSKKKNDVQKGQALRIYPS